MALGTAIVLKPFNPAAEVQAPVSRGKWTTAVEAGGIATTDNSAARVRNPRSMTSSTARKPIRLPESCSSILVRMGYDDDFVFTTDPTIQVFGFDGEDDAAAFCLLHNSATSPLDELPIVAAETTDITDGTLKYTDVLLTTHRFNVKGHPYIVIAVKTAATKASGGGDLTNAIIQIKPE